MMDSNEVHATLMRLPPGPWHSVGNTIRAGSQNIGHVTFSRPGIPASFIARMLAMLPDLLSAQAEADEANVEKVATLESKVEELEDRLSEVEAELAGYKAAEKKQ